MKNLLQSVSRSAAWSAGWTIAQPMRPPFLRRAILTRSFFLALMVMTVVTPMLGQALPAAEAAPISTGFALPRTAGTLNYAVSGSEEATWGYYGNQGAYAATNLSGDVAFITNSKLYPFSLILSGGRSWSSMGPSYGFSSLGLSQVLNLKRWNIVVSDSLSYLPSTPTAGLSGVPGVGDLGINPVQVGGDTGQGVLTAYSSRIANTAAGSIQRQLTGQTSVNASGSYGILRFLGSGGGGIDGGSVTGGVGISHQLSALTSFSGNYSYSSFTYSDASHLPGFASQTASLQFARRLTRRLSMSVSAGPQWTSIDSPGSSQGVNVAANASLSYGGQFTHVAISYTRGTNSGSGVVGGALSQGGTISAGRTFARVWSCSVNASYTQSSSLPFANASPFSVDATVASAQVSRAIMRSLSAYASYTIEHQSSPGSTSAVDVFSGLEQVVGFGVTYSPSSIHLGRQ